MEITKRLLELIGEKSLSQKDLSMITGLTESTISRYVSGERIPRGANLVKLAKALDTTVDDLLGNNREEDDIEEIINLVARNSEKMDVEDKMRIINLVSRKEEWWDYQMKYMRI